jgi:hypothetical protein
MEHDTTVLDTVVMPKSNAYSESNVSLRILANNHDYSRIRKFAKKILTVETPETHYLYSKELWDEYNKIKDPKKKADVLSLSIVHYALSNNKTPFWL